jgi:S1-C subfamily serine protease
MTKSPRTQNLLAGLLGGLVAVIVGGVLLATGAIDTGDTKTVVEQAPIARQTSVDKASDGLTVSDIYRRDGPGVVFVRAQVEQQGSSPFGLPQPDQGTATGSGFVLDKEGYILTNAHVVEGAKDVTVRFGDPRDVDAKIVGTDLSTDLAVLKIDPDDANLKPLDLGDSNRAQVGDPVVAIGNPFGLDRTVTTGIVSAKQRQITAPNGFSIDNVIQTDAAINPGNSGGPLIDSNGRVIGINSQIATGGGGGSVGVGFAVPSNTAERVIPQLKKGGKVERAYLGVETTDVTEQLAEDLNLPVKQGALIQRVIDGGPADKAGLRGGRTQTTEGIRAGGDLIVKVDGKDVQDAADVAAAIEGKKPGDDVQVEYYRGNDEKSAKVELGKRPARLDQSGGQQQPDENPFPFP